MNPDFVDLLRAFAAADVRFMIVGAYALAVHGRPRATGDLDVWVEPRARTPVNLREGTRVREPRDRTLVTNRASFLLNKRATGRLKDLSDVEGMD